MTIILRPDQERVLVDAINSGLAHTADEALDQALDALRLRMPPQAPAATSDEPPGKRRTGQELIDASAKVRGLLTDEEVDTLFSRKPSFARPVDLE